MSDQRTMTAKEHVEIAKRAARITLASNRIGGANRFVSVCLDAKAPYGWYLQWGMAPVPGAVLYAALSPESTASAAALERALLASTFRYIPSDEGTVFVTWPGMPQGARPGEHDSEDAARTVLLDALLGEEAA